MHISPRIQGRKVSDLRVARGLLAGAATGAFLIALFLAPFAPLAAPFVFVFAFIVWLIGEIVLGLPLWALTIRLGVDGLCSAVIVGAATPSLTLLALGALGGGMGPVSLFSGLIALFGAIVGLAVWLTAYRPWNGTRGDDGEPRSGWPH